MFIIFTADDAVQSYTLDAVNQFLAQRKNPNGCPIKMTYYTSIQYTNFTLVTDWFVAGNEIADHTMTHVGSPDADELNGNLIALNTFGGIPLESIKGFRAPFLNYTVDTLKLLYQSEFTYDSSSAAALPVTADGTDAYWPYTLDNGFANDCLAVEGLCQGEPKLPGFWELPMYGLFDSRGVNGVHLMDPWLDAANGATAVNNSATLAYMKSTFTDHYNGNRQPFGLYTHPIHLSKTVPGTLVTQDMIDMINDFLDWAQAQQNVWIISNEQLMAWVQNPTTIANLGNVDALKCSTPQVEQKICNGMPQNEDGLLSHCAFNDFPWFTCYGCPTIQPIPGNPNPPQVTDVPARFRLPANCSTPFWDPIAGNCTCTSASCAFVDNSRPIGPNGANLTGGGTGSNFSDPSTTSYLPFNSAVSSFLPSGWWQTFAIGAVGMAIGAAEVFNRRV